MKKKLIYGGAILALVILVILIKPMFFHMGYTSAEDLKIKDGVFQEEDGTPFTGKVELGEDDAEFVLTNMASFAQNSGLRLPGIGRLGRNSGNVSTETKAKLKEALKGFTVHFEVEDGKPSGTAELFFDVRSGRQEIFGKDIDQNTSFAGAYLFSNQIRLAYAELKSGSLDGEAVLVNPSAFTEDKILAKATFKNNVLLNTERYHVNGQLKRLNNFNEQGRKEGVQKEFGESGKVTWEGHFENNYIKWEKGYYEEQGTLRKEVKYDDNGRMTLHSEFYPDGKESLLIEDSLETEWYSNGTIKIKKQRVAKQRSYNFYRPQAVVYERGTPVGEILTYHPSGKIKTSMVYNEDGEANGPYIINYGSGKAWEKGTMRNGRKHGNLKKWYKNEQLAEDHEMVNGSIDGAYVRYYDSGKKWKELNYDHGILDGDYKTWYKNEQVSENHKVVNGKIEGNYVRYYADGTKWKEGKYEDGRKEGTFKKWFMDGTLASDCEYEFGRKISCSK